MVNPFFQRKLRKILDSHDEESIIINLGSGPTYFMGRRDIINIDIFPFREVDVVADAVNLPVKDESVDLILNLALLEHVADPEAVVKEMHRIVRKREKVICYIPFIVPFHPAPDDFQRWTRTGVRKLFSCFDRIEISIGCGPTSGMLWVFQEWFSIFLSFGNRTVHDILLLVLMVITAPIKLLDVFMIKFPDAEKIASGFYVIAKKEERRKEEAS
jgi:SAM-dependent methyltransferase